MLACARERSPKQPGPITVIRATDEDMRSHGMSASAACFTQCASNTIFIRNGQSVRCIAHEFVHVVQGCPAVLLPDGGVGQHPYFGEDGWEAWMAEVRSCGGF